jgi:hypothetical protein
MKRDKELIKAILIYAEEYEGRGSPVVTPEILPSEFHDVPLGNLVQHGQLMIDCGLIKGSSSRNGVVVTGITWDGYEFLDNARNTKVWNSALKAAGGASWGVFVNVLTALAIDQAKSLIAGM